MPTKSLTYEQCAETLRTVNHFAKRGHDLKGTCNGMGALGLAADVLGIDRKSVNHRMAKAKEQYGLTLENVGKPERIAADIDEDRPDPIALLDNLEPEDTRVLEKAKKKPHVILVPPEPFAVAFVGDPHLSNHGCNRRAFRDDMALLRDHQIRAIQMGDLLDNFHRAGPKLAPKEAHNRMTIKEALSVAKWAVCEAGVPWDAHIIGNHDAWMGDEGVSLLGEWVKQGKSRLYDWNAQIIYHWGSGSCHIAASHDMKGHSQYNPLHGPGKMALWDGQADVYVAAHRHNHANANIPNGWRGKTYNLVRVRGYKDADDYAAGRAQFPSHEGMEGRSAMLVVDPLSPTHSGQRKVFMDLADGLQYLQLLKNRAA